MSQSLNSALSAAVLRLLRPLVAILIRHGIPYGVFAEVARKAYVDEAICSQISHKDIGQVGVRFMKFCGRYELNKATESAEQYAAWLNQTYQGVLDDHSQSSYS